MLAENIGIPQLRDLANRSVQCTDKIGLSEMTRLAELACSSEVADSNPLDVQISFQPGSQGFPEISGVVSGSLDLRCQRCLGVLRWPLDLKFRLAVLEKEDDIESVAEPFDTVVAGNDGVRIAELVEDELLASLPLAPAHKDLADCSDSALVAKKLVGANANTGSGDARDSDMTRPFADLDVMLKRTDAADHDDQT